MRRPEASRLSLQEGTCRIELQGWRQCSPFQLATHTSPEISTFLSVRGSGAARVAEFSDGSSAIPNIACHQSLAAFLVPILS